jgi:hypothetical protein
MLFQDVQAVYTNLLMVISVIGLIFGFLFFLIPFMKYIMVKRLNALYLGLSNLMISLMQIPILIGLAELSFRGGVYNNIYYIGIATALSLEVFSAFFLFLFTNESFSYSKMQRNVVIGSGIVALLAQIVNIIILAGEDFDIGVGKYLILGITALYLLMVYGMMAIKFNKLYKTTDKTVAKLKSIYIGAVFMILFIVLLSAGGPFSGNIIGKIFMMAGFAMLFVAVISFFYGFIKPQK